MTPLARPRMPSVPKYLRTTLAVPQTRSLPRPSRWTGRLALLASEIVSKRAHQPAARTITLLESYRRAGNNAKAGNEPALRPKGVVGLSFVLVALLFVDLA